MSTWGVGHLGWHSVLKSYRLVFSSHKRFPGYNEIFIVCNSVQKKIIKQAICEYIVVIENQTYVRGLKCDSSLVTRTGH